MLLALCIGFAVAGIGAFIAMRLNERGALTALPRHSDILAAAQRYVSVRTALLTMGTIALIYAFFIVLFPEPFHFFFQSRLFWPITVGIIVAAVLNTFGKVGMRLSGLILLLLLVASGQELWNHRPPSLKEVRNPEQKAVGTLQEKKEAIVPELYVALPSDGCWSQWIQGNKLQWSGQGDDLYVSTESGKTYPLRTQNINGWFLRFRAANGGEGRSIHVTGEQLSYANQERVPKAVHSEIFPNDDDPQELGDTTLVFVGEHMRDSLPQDWRRIELESVAGDGLLTIFDSNGKVHSYEMDQLSLANTQSWLREARSLLFIAHSATSAPMVIKVKYRNRGGSEQSCF